MAIFANLVPGHEDFEIEDEIGYGTFSEVHRARNKATGELVALKHVVYTEPNKFPCHLSREYAALTALQGHPNIIALDQICQQEWSACLVLQHCVADVSKVLRRMQGQPLPASITKAIMTSLLHALKCVHAAGFIHRDVSPSNVLFDVSGGMRLSDFGQARRTSPSPAANGPASNENVVSQGSSTLHAAQQEEDTDTAMSPMVGTRWYRAPELLFGARRYSAAVDMWSVGCLFAEMLTGRALFPGTSDIDQICRIRDVLGSPTLENWPGAEALPDWGKLVFPPQQARPWAEVMTSQMDNVSAVELLDGLIKYDPTTRLTAAQALDVEYFKQQPLAAENGQVAALVESLVGKKSE